MPKKYSDIEGEVERIREAESDLRRLTDLKDEETDLISRRKAVEFAIDTVRSEIESIEQKMKNSQSA